MLISRVDSATVAHETGIAREYSQAFIAAIRSVPRNASVTWARGSISVNFAGSSHPDGGCDVRLSDDGFGELRVALSWHSRVLRVRETILEQTVLDRAGIGTISIYGLGGYLKRNIPDRS